VIDRKIRFTNGFCFGIDNTLYANASFAGEVYAYNVTEMSKGQVEQLDAPCAGRHRSQSE
jgi:sugar lactone lactonase YvrE